MNNKQDTNKINIKEKNSSKNQFLSKKSIFIIVLIIIVLIVSVVLILLNKKRGIDGIVVSELEHITLLDKDNEVEAAKLIKNNIVRIINKIDDETNIVGTGFFIKEGYVITNSHIVDIYGDITIEYNDGSTSNAYLYSNSVVYDIAILKVADVKVKALLLSDSNKIEVTNNVLSAGYAYNFAGEASISKGILSARRQVNEINYLQSDISIDTGSSGGPLFTPKAEVIGMNTYVTENRTFALSLSSETIDMVIAILLVDPTIEYLTEERPSNYINKILVEVGFTDNENLELYNDKDMINKSKSRNRKKIDALEENNNVTTSNNNHREYYYCDSGYLLVGSKCVSNITYQAIEEYGECKEGYEKNNNQCTKKKIIDAVAYYPCENGTLTANNTCIEKTLEVGGGQSVSMRWGSCPNGKKCYDMGKNYYTNTLNKKFVSELVCPSGSNKITTSVRYIWNGEAMDKANIKTWNSASPGAYIEHDSDGLVYYTDTSSVLSMCAKSYDSENNAYVLYTYDDLKNSTCVNGGTFTANTNNQGFYCLLSTSIHMYAWDPVCYDSAYSWIKDGDTYYCGRYIDEEYIVNPSYSCNEGLMRSDGKTCLVTDTYNLTPIYKCNKGDTNSGPNCQKTIIVDAKKNN